MDLIELNKMVNDFLQNNCKDISNYNSVGEVIVDFLNYIATYSALNQI